MHDISLSVDTTMLPYVILTPDITIRLSELDLYWQTPGIYVIYRCAISCNSDKFPIQNRCILRTWMPCRTRLSNVLPKR